MTPKNRVESIMRDPLLVHAELKRRGSNFSDIARALSTSERSITPQHVRAVVYGISSTHRDLILAAIRNVLSAKRVSGAQPRV